MKAFLDTSVLVATFYGDHERHVPSLDLFLRFGKQDACCGAHSLTEVYAVLAARLTGGAIYDALLGTCALKAGAETLYTWNVKDFLRLPPAVAGRVRRPDA